MIKIANLNKSFGTTKVLKGINLSFNNYGLYFIKGRSGSGKSTLFKIIAGVDKDYTGSCRVFSKEISSLKEKELSNLRFSKVSFSIQSNLFEDNQTVSNYFEKILDVSFDKNSKKEQLDKLLKYFGLYDKLKQKCKDLSGGERKRINLIMSLLKDCPIVLLDEPTAGLDQIMQDKLFKFLEEFSKNHLVIIITHENVDKERFKVLEFNNGTINFDDDKEIKLNVEKDRKFKMMSLKHIVKNFLSSFAKHRKKLMFSMTSIIISLVCFAFVFILTNGVKDSLFSSFDAIMGSNTITMTNKESLEDVTIEQISSDDLTKIKHKLNKFNLIDREYVDENIAEKIDLDFRLFTKDNELLLTYLSFNEVNYYALDKSLKFDEKCFGISLEEKHFSEILKSFNIKENSLINGEIRDIPLNIECFINEESFINYRIEFIKKGDKNTIITSNKNFISSMLKDLGFVSSNENFIEHILQIEQTNFIDFYIAFRKDNDLQFIDLEIVSSFDNFLFLKFIEHDFEGLNNTLKSKIEREYFVNNVNVSTSIYQFGFNGLYTGFVTPIFFSLSSQEIDRFIDDNRKTSVNLSEFQTSAYNIPRTLLKGGVEPKPISDNVKLKTNRSNKNLKGNEIAISSGLMKKLKEHINVLDESNIYVTILRATDKVDNKYINYFEKFNLKIKEVVPDVEDTLIYQDEYFFEGINILLNKPKVLSTLNSAFHLQINGAFKIEDIQVVLKDKYKNYIFAIPLEDAKKDVSFLINNIAMLLLGFAFLIGFIACSLLYLSLFLVVKSEEDKIREIMLLGYPKKELYRYYCLYVFFVSSFSSISACIGTSILYLITKNMLQSMLDIVKINLISPMLIILSIGFLVGLFVSLITTLKIRKLELFKLLSKH